MPHLLKRSLYTVDLTNQRSRVKVRLGKEKGKAERLKWRVAAIKNEIARLRLLVDNATLEYEQNPVRLTAVPYRMKDCDY